MMKRMSSFELQRFLAGELCPANTPYRLPSTVSEESNNNAASVLLVDDDEDIRESLAYVLQAEGYRVELASNGQEALERLHSGPAPSVVVLDLMMPVMSGWRFLEELSALQSTVPVLVVSAAVPPKPAGVAGCLGKPFDLDTLLAKVAECVGTGRAA
jgi:two-component system response regulator MprA